MWMSISVDNVCWMKEWSPLCAILAKKAEFSWQSHADSVNICQNALLSSFWCPNPVGWPGSGPVEPGSWTNTSHTASLKFTGVRKMTQRRSLEMCRVCCNGVYLVLQVSNTNKWADPRTRITALKLLPSYCNPFLIGVRHGLICLWLFSLLDFYGLTHLWPR